MTQRHTLREWDDPDNALTETRNISRAAPLARWVSKPSSLLSAHTQHPWQDALLNPRNRDGGYRKFPELPYTAWKEASKGV